MAQENAHTTIEYELALVSFIDILGFRQMLETESAQSVYNALISLTEFNKSALDDSDVFQEPGSERMISRSFVSTVSDAIVRVRPFQTHYRDGALFHELSDLAFAQAALAEMGVFIRGGMAIGQVYCGPDGGGPVFGPAMVRAYEIESKEALYPRIAIDENVIEHFNNNPDLRSSQNSFEFENEYVSKQLARGDDGLLYVDY